MSVSDRYAKSIALIKCKFTLYLIDIGLYISDRYAKSSGMNCPYKSRLDGLENDFKAASTIEW